MSVAFTGDFAGSTKENVVFTYVDTYRIACRYI